MNTQKGFSSLFILSLLIILIGGGLYLYSEKTSKEIVSNKLSDEVILKAVSDPKGKIMARGDVNGDGFEDAIVQGISCGASCAVFLEVVLNNKNIDAQLLNVSFEPGFKSSSAAKSQLTNVSIVDEVISLTGYGLDCGGNSGLDSDVCTEENWNIIRTINYKLDLIPGSLEYSLERI